MSKSWKHIVNNKIEEIEVPHILDGEKNKKNFLLIFLEDLNLKKEEYEILSEEKNVFTVKIKNFKYNIFIEQPDSGGRKDLKKKLEIKFANKRVQELIREEEKILFINVYIPLLNNNNNNFELDNQKRIYIFLRPNEIFQSSTYDKIKENNEKIFPSSRWFSLINVFEVLNNSENLIIEKSLENNKEYKYQISNNVKNKNKKDAKDFNIYIVDKENLPFLFYEKIQKEFFGEGFTTVEKIVKNYWKELKNDNSKIYQKYRNSFREELLIKRGSKCEIIDCNIRLKEMLVASHIMPVAEIIHNTTIVEEEKKKMISDIDNGFLFCANHDKLFDRFLISFNIEGEVFINSDIEEKIDSTLFLKKEKSILKISNNKKINFYLEFHNDKYNEKNKNMKNNI